jgi:hypothetical protein
MKIPIALVLCLGAATHAAAQLQPYDVWRACQHPQAMDSSEYRRVRESLSEPQRSKLDSANLEPDAKLHFLCADLRVPASPARIRDVDRSLWKRAFTEADVLPSSQDIRGYSDSAAMAIARWKQVQQPQIGDGLAIGTDAILFVSGSDSVAAEYDGAIQRLADQVAAVLATDPGARVRIHAGADPTTRPGMSLREGLQYNRDLAGRRAANILQAIHRKRSDIDLTRVSAVGSVGTEEKGADVNGSRAGENLLLRSGGASLADNVAPSVMRSTDVFESRSAGAQTLSQATSLTGIVADAVIAQAREQVQLYVTGEVIRKMCEGDRVNLVPVTCSLFRADTATSSYTPTLAALNSAIRSDLEHTLPRIVVRQYSKGENLTEEAAASVLLLEFLPRVASGEDPMQALATVAENLPSPLVEHTSFARTLHDVAPWIGIYRTARLELAGLEIDPSALPQVVLETSLRAFAVDAQEKREVWKDRLARADTLVETAATLADAAVAMNARLRELSSQSRGASGEVRLANAASFLTTSIELGLAVADMPSLREEVGPRVRMVAVPVRDLVLAVQQREYRRAILQVTELSRLLSDSTTNCYTRVGTDDRSTCTGGLPPDFSSDVLRFASFASDLAGSQDEASIQHAMQRFIGQDAGYRAKRTGKRGGGVTVNSYLGVGAAEQVSTTSPVTQLAVYLPVGVEFYSRRNRNAFISSSSVFVQLVDLGSIAASRLEVAGDAHAPDPDVAQVIAPGLFLVGALGRSPFSIGGGVSFAPRALTVPAETGAEESSIRNGCRFSLFAGVDVPLFSFH